MFPRDGRAGIEGERGSDSPSARVIGRCIDGQGRSPERTVSETLHDD
jgi:hypothetical protein